MAERPLIFSEEMVLALLDGAKSVTRRPVTAANTLVDGVGRRAFPPGLDLERARVDKGPSPMGNPGPYLRAPRVPPDEPEEEFWHRLYPRLWKGDLLWVKERAYVAPPDFTDDPEHTTSTDPQGRRRLVGYAASMEGDACRCAEDYGVPLSPAIFLPRWASRVTLEVLSVRPERLHAITEEEAEKEGVGAEFEMDLADFVTGRPTPPSTHLLGFKHAWNRIHGHGSWEKNCWVWRIEFTLKERR